MTPIGQSTPLAALDCVVLDTETTGLDAATARLVQIGAVRIDAGVLRPERCLDSLVAPGIPVPPASSAVHGVTDAALVGAPTFAQLAQPLRDFIGRSIVVGHTIGFDLTILHREAELARCSWPPLPALDVRTLAELARPSLAQYDLDRIAAVLGVTIEGRHTALGDAMATARIFLGLLPLLRERGIRTLAEAEAASRHLADRQASAGVRGYTVPGDGQPTAPRSLARIDSFPYRHRIADVMSTPPVWCPGTATLREVMERLIEHHVSSVLVDTPGHPPGIFTERDVLRALATDRPGGLDRPVGPLAIRPLQTVPVDAFVYRAIGRIGRLGIRHLAVTGPDGGIVGMVTTRNLLRHRGSTAIVLGDAIDSAGTPGELGKAWADLVPMARSLMGEAVDPRLIAGVISDEIAALTRRAAQIGEIRMAEAGQGPPPCPYAVMVLGSVGRGESLLAADQDNAIVMAEGEPGGPQDQWFAALGRHIADILDEVGVPYCKGGVMAREPAWRHSVAGWCNVIDGWVRRQRPEDLLSVDIFFDGMSVHGDSALADRIMAHAFARAGQAKDFQLQIAELARRWHSPIGWLGGLKSDGHGRLDLKLHGLMPIFTAARALALRHGIRARSTPERLRTLTAHGVGNIGEIEALVAAHGVIMGEMLEQQAIDAEHGVPLSPRVDLKRFDAAGKAALKDALAGVSTAVDLAGEGRL
jgi:CBS domain-containing protein